MKLGKIGVWVALDGPIGFFEDDRSAELGRATAPRVAKFARRVEELGYAAIWMPDGSGRDPFIASSLLLASTQDLIAATGISSIYSRDPVASAAAAHALNEWSGGRFIMGLGVSHPPFAEGIRGHNYSKPVSAMRAYLDGIADAPYHAAGGKFWGPASCCASGRSSFLKPTPSRRAPSPERSLKPILTSTIT